MQAKSSAQVAATNHDSFFGLRNDVLLVGRVYFCRNKHQILSHDQGILSQVKADFQLPFVLFHKSGVTRELCRFFISHISAGMTIADVQVLWQQSLFDEYGSILEALDGCPALTLSGVM